jgi:hypothetical protein
MPDYNDRPLDVLPGLFKETSGYAARGRYVDGNNVRFWKGYPERIGGWDNLVDTGTMSSTVTITIASPGVVSWTDHRLVPGQPVVLTTTGALPTGLTAGTTYYVIAAGIGADVFRVSATVGGAAINTSGTQSGTHTATAAVAPARGATAWKTLANVQYAGYGTAYGLFVMTGGNVSNITPTSGFSLGTINGATTFGWGDSGWGNPVFGGAETIYTSVSVALVWTLGLWGEDLVACPRGQGIFAWDASAGTGTEAATIAGAPTSANGIFVSDTNRTLVAYGAHDGSALDPLLIRWSDQEDYTTWAPASTNTAGSIRAEDGNEIIGAIPAREGHLIITDTATYIFRYVGGTFVFALNKIATGPSMIAPHAGVQDAFGQTYWMGPRGFFVYDGTVRVLPCDVQSDVFSNMNVGQRFKVFCGTIREFNEVIWFYPKTGSSEINACVAVNTIDGTWWQGDVSRTSWVDKSVVVDFPIGWASDGMIYAHEYNDTGDGEPIEYFWETADIDTGDGAFLHQRKIIPDYDRITGTHTVTIYNKGYPNRAATTSGPYSIDSDTYQLSIRGRGREVRLRGEGSDDFRMGRWQVRVRPHGMKE